MSLGGGGGGGTPWWVLQEHQNQMNKLNEERASVQAEKDRVAADSATKAAEEEKKRVANAKGGGLAAFTTNAYVGYSDRTLGGGNSLSVT